MKSLRGLGVSHPGSVSGLEIWALKLGCLEVRHSGFDGFDSEVGMNPKCSTYLRRCMGLMVDSEVGMNPKCSTCARFRGFPILGVHGRSQAVVVSLSTGLRGLEFQADGFKTLLSGIGVNWVLTLSCQVLMLNSSSV